MRAALLILAVFCALISGWTSSLARMQDLGGMMAMHHASASAHHRASPSAHHRASATAAHHQCAADAKDCDHHSRTVHPLLCAACFATAPDSHDLDRDALAASTIRPLPQAPMRAVALEPQFPPPKTSLFIC